MLIFPHQQAEKSPQNQHDLPILHVDSNQLQYRFFRTSKPKSRHKTNTFCPLTLVSYNPNPHTGGGGHEKSTPTGVLFINAEPPPVDRTEGGRCAPEGTRTPNLLNRNQMLYPLSYGRFAVWLSISLHASHRDAKSNDVA